jgi:hypothetical protein
MENAVEKIRGRIEDIGLEGTFWNTFDAYARVIGTSAWNSALKSLPEGLMENVSEHELESNLDWDYWGSSSFFGLSFEAGDAGLYFDGHERECIDFLGAIEDEMWGIVCKDENFEAFDEALRSLGDLE